MTTSILSQIAKYVLLSEAAYADFTTRDEQDNITGIFNSSTAPNKITNALADHEMGGKNRRNL